MMTTGAVLLAVWVVFSLAAHWYNSRALRIAREEIDDVPATLSRFGVLSDDEDFSDWMPALMSSFLSSRSWADACLVRQARQQIVVRRGTDVEDLLLSASSFRKSRTLRNGLISYRPSRRDKDGESFLIILRQEQLASLDVRWGRLWPPFLRWPSNAQSR